MTYYFKILQQIQYENCLFPWSGQKGGLPLDPAKRESDSYKNSRGIST
jgi:hypothetical protein